MISGTGAKALDKHLKSATFWRYKLSRNIKNQKDNVVNDFNGEISLNFCVFLFATVGEKAETVCKD